MSGSISDLAHKLFLAGKRKTPIQQLTQANKLTLSQAYEIQRHGVELRKQEQNVNGYKLGFTGESKRIQMGVEDIIIGTLFETDEVKNGSEVSLSHWLNPKVEPEIAFLLAEDIDHELKLDEVMKVIQAVAPALEIADSRYTNFTFNLVDVVADNSFSGSYVLGDWQKPDFDLTDLPIEMHIDGTLRQQGLGSAIMGNPLLALKELSRLALEHKMPLKKGYIIMAGAATNAESLQTGMKVSGEFMKLGRVSINIS